MYKNKHTKNTKKIVKAVMVLVPMLLVGASLLMAPIDVQALNEILVTFEHCPPDCGSWPAPPGGGSSGDLSETDSDTTDGNSDDGLTSDSKADQAGQSSGVRVKSTTASFNTIAVN